MMKKSVNLVSLLFIAAISYYVCFVHINYRFESISDGKVYKSAAIPPEKLSMFITKHNIKTVIDLRDPGVQDALNPGNQQEIDDEASAISKMDGVMHINIPSQQVPTKRTLNRFLEILDDKTNYPVLIHCHHGTGRAEIYSALYRIEYEGWDNGSAQSKTRAIIEIGGYKSSFAPGKPKGDFLINYKPRLLDSRSTLLGMEE